MFHYMIGNYSEALYITAICMQINHLYAPFRESIPWGPEDDLQMVHEVSGLQTYMQFKDECDPRVRPERNLYVILSTALRYPEPIRPLKDVIGSFYIAEVMYVLGEILAVPKPFWYEIGRANIVRNMKRSTSYTHRDIACNFVHSFAAVDSIAFVHFVRFLCYYKLGRCSDVKRTLMEFNRDIRKRGENLRHYAPALNLLAQCYYMAGDVERAIKNLATSVQVEPSYTHNAALWILGVIMYENTTGTSCTQAY